MRTLPLAAAAVALLFSACADRHNVVRTPSSSQPSAAIAQGGTAYIAVAQDGRYGNQVYTGSAATTAQVVSSAFAPYMRSITVSPKTEDFDQALRSARAGNFVYMIYPQILQWEDRATEWSMKPDVASVKVTVVNAKTGEVINSAVINGKSGLATFGGDKPQDLLPKPMAEYAASVFR